MDESVTDAAAAEAAAAAAGGFALQRQEELSQDDREELQAIEVYFHGLIYERNGGAARLDPLLAQNNYQLPSLVEHVKAYDDNSHYYNIPGMYGGFDITVSKGKEWMLTSTSWIRVVGGVGQGLLASRERAPLTSAPSL